MWSNEKPKEPGYYWYQDRVSKPEILIVDDFHGELCVNCGDDWEGLGYYPGVFQGPITPEGEE